ncbi:AraC family transcriptional regulator [Pseudomonas sp. N040]|uniref:AraC family transcriptional regulator n=1 Tax=Pseudomonas sp. N040 TaxID=2785325 RepID=UPI0018A2E323|nr:AraC family transcriptional regulator [Pseudomonas sp. N040]MBF7729916.1 AraC family transcriptional regulator [Pseudomonas sp. N040]MBW7013558.1 AraC family transcriptional regulator [Pseudomonas sp. N040]
MHTAPALIRARALSGFPALVQSLGGDVDALLQGAGLSRRMLENPEDCVALDRVAQVLDAAATQLAVPDFGLRLSLQQDISVLGTVALIAQHSATLGESLANIARHLPYHTPNAQLLLDADSGRHGYMRICYELTLQDAWLRRQPVELSYGILQRTLQMLSGESGTDWHVDFRHPAGCSAECYQRYFAGSLGFGRPQDALSIPARLLEIPLASAGGSLRETAERFVQNIVRRFPLDVTHQVESLVERQLAVGGGSLVRVAQQLGLHERTLQRRLAEQGCYFEEIVDRLRRQRASSLLLDSALPLAEISAALGYSEQSSFNRSCSRWFGMPPNAYRREAKA